MNFHPIAHAPLDGKRFDVAVIGGGINGVAIARECAQAGKTILLIEKNDFGAGATSRSTRLIHGGLRYLEHGEISLVRESLRERRRLLQEYPHLVRPQMFLLAMGPDSPRSALQVRVGLWMYKHMAGAQLLSSDPSQEIAALERLLDNGSNWTIFDYEDAQCEFPERLVAEWLVEAMQAGAIVRNHTELLAIERQNDAVRAVRLRDSITGEESRVEAGWIVNASGPWVDQVCQIAGMNLPRLIGGVRGSHIAIPRFPGAPKAAIYLEAHDRRPVFVIPWNGQLLVGTTEIADDGNPTDATASHAEIDYLLNCLKAKFPGTTFTRDHILYAYAGVRPLPFMPGKPMSVVSRRHYLHNHKDDGARGMISIVGGKLTTAARLGREVARALGIAVPEPPVLVAAIQNETAIADCLDSWSRQAAKQAGISQNAAHGIALWHGRYATAVARMAMMNESMREPLCPHTGHIVAEVAYGFANEGARTLGDALLRRVPVAFSACWNEDCSAAATSAVGRALGWNEKKMAAELESFEVERTAFLQKVVLVKSVS